MKRAFILTFMTTLILFFTAFGISESYIAMQNTTSKDKITSVMEGFIDKEKNEIEIHFLGEEFIRFPIYEISIPHEFSAFVPPYLRVLWIGIDKNIPHEMWGIFLFFRRFFFFLFFGLFFCFFFCLLFFFRSLFRSFFSLFFSLFSVVILNFV